ncbi:phage holin family protein [Variovorax sp. MHTC-1]|uniref:phage holin family protein n=1 Tax=Variovorax sp. MHTC-1 TaxID=2495593 RepID=UPI000F8965E1|nr:phage holin family protein [Variovorax sp. MHTC-1]RST53212.1 phage holin family protein [Variovorax sp. MHTC-1]
MKLLSLFGLESRLRRLRIAAGEGALAAEDRVQLLRLAWEEEKQRLQLMLVLVIAVIGLTTVAVALLSVAVVVHFWETPTRVAAAWTVAAVWIGLWLVAAAALMRTLRKTSEAFDPARGEFERDWEWVQGRFGLGDEGEAPPREPRPRTREELLQRIARQRERIATLQGASSEKADAPPMDESPSAAALRIAREHPVATGVVTAAVVAVLGPRRVLRWAAVVVPVLWRMR